MHGPPYFTLASLVAEPVGNLLHSVRSHCDASNLFSSSEGYTESRDDAQTTLSKSWLLSASDVSAATSIDVVKVFLD